MSDLLGGGGAAASDGTGLPRPQPARAPVGSPSGIRGPRIIMQERAAREARQREERERMEREHAEAEARALQETQRREAERRAPLAAAGAGVSGTGVIPTATESSAARRAAATAASGRPAAEAGARATGSARATVGAQTQPSQRHARTASAPAPQPAAAATAGATAGSSGEQPLPTTDPLGAGTRSRNSFPHAFERWETLSAHWEGLTSFWIRRLEQNTQELSSEPLNQQLARQVTDLSSAGANLFHAVVELQRLRASSERKFQRWFFETRAEMERQQEMTAMLEAALEEERRSKADAVREALENSQPNSKVQKQLEEMRRELLISKDEARRAWEELGRRAQEERDRTNSLQQGHPTVVGGVQVVPMTQGVSRGNSQRDPQTYASAEPDYPQGSASRPEYTQAPAVQPVSSSGGATAYQQPSTMVHHQGSYGSEGTYSEVGDSDTGPEEYETPGQQRPQQPQYSSQPQYSTEPEYEGEGFDPTGWATMEASMGGPRHHHPTRLSDVIEEEERSSQSQVSRA